MKALGLIVVVLVLVVGGAGGLAYAWQPSIAPIDPPAPASFDAAMVAHGAQLAAIGDCASCHNTKQGGRFAGGLPLKTPFGVIYSTNITPDPETGIGRWPLEAFTRALRRGVSRDGHLLYPAFPYAHFTHMSDADIAAIYAFLMTREPVQAVAPANRLVFPLNFRPLVAGWNLLFLHAGALPDATSQSVEWQRGRYLVEGPGHCAACHTPMNSLGAERGDQPYVGGLIDGWNGPALNALSQAPIPWTKPQLVAYLRTGLAGEHGAAAGPMLPVTQQLAHVQEDDVAAIATYLLSLQKPASGGAATNAFDRDMAASAAQASGASATSATLAASTRASSTASGSVDGATASATATDTATDTASRMQHGALLFSATCAACHSGAAPMTTIGARPALGLSSTLNAADPRNVINLILGGIPWAGTDRVHYMPPFGDALSNDQIADIAMYMRAQFTQQPAWPALDDSVARVRKESNPS